MEKIINVEYGDAKLEGFFNLDKATEIDFIQLNNRHGSTLYLTAKKGRLVESIKDVYGNLSHFQLIELEDAIVKYDDVIDELLKTKNKVLCAEIKTLINNMEL